MEKEETNLNLLLRQLYNLLDCAKYDIYNSFSKLEEINFDLIEEERKEKNIQ